MRTLMRCLVIILLLFTGNLAEPFWLNEVAVQVTGVAVTLSETRDQSLSDISRQELGYARELLASQRVSSSGSIAYQALIAHLTLPPDLRVGILEDLVNISGEVRPVVKFWLGEAYLEQGDYLKALSLWDEIGAAQQLFELGDRLSEVGWWEEAVASYEASLESFSSDIQVYFKLGHSLEQLGRQEDALEIYARALTTAPRNYGVYIAIGNIYRDRGMFDEAQAWYDRAIQETGHWEWPYLASALAYVKQGALVLAEDRLQVVLQEYSGNCQAWGQMGQVLWQKGIYDKAIQALEEAVALCPYQFPWMHKSLGDVRRDNGDVEGALQAYEVFQDLTK